MIQIEYKDGTSVTFIWSNVSHVRGGEQTQIILNSGEVIKTSADKQVVFHLLMLDARLENPWERKYNLGYWGIDKRGAVVELTDENVE